MSNQPQGTGEGRGVERIGEEGETENILRKLVNIVRRKKGLLKNMGKRETNAIKKLKHSEN